MKVRARLSFIEIMARRFVQALRKSAAESRDLRRLNRHAQRLNAEAMDALKYQAPWLDE